MGHPFQWQAITFFKMPRNSVSITCFVQTFSEAINEINILMVLDRKLNKLILSWTEVNKSSRFWYAPIKLELYNNINTSLGIPSVTYFIQAYRITSQV